RRRLGEWSIHSAHDRTRVTMVTTQGGGRMPRSANPRRSAVVLTVAVVIAGASAVLGAIAFWPRGDPPDLGVVPNTYVDATVVDVTSDPCLDTEITAPDCRTVRAELTTGEDAGEIVEF